MPEASQTHQASHTQGRLLAYPPKHIHRRPFRPTYPPTHAGMRAEQAQLPTHAHAADTQDFHLMGVHFMEPSVFFVMMPGRTCRGPSGDPTQHMRPQRRPDALLGLWKQHESATLDLWMTEEKLTNSKSENVAEQFYLKT